MQKTILLIAVCLFLLPLTVAASQDTLTVQTAAYTGITPDFTAASDTVYVPNNGKTLVEIKNGAGAGITVTVVSRYANQEGIAAANASITVAATTGHKLIGPFRQDIWNNDSGQLMLIFSSTATVTVGARRIHP